MSGISIVTMSDNFLISFSYCLLRGSKPLSCHSDIESIQLVGIGAGSHYSLSAYSLSIEQLELVKVVIRVLILSRKVRMTSQNQKQSFILVVNILL